MASEPKPLFRTEFENGVLTATYSSDPLNYLNLDALAELEQLVVEWQDPRYRVIILQSEPDEIGFMTHFSVEQLHAMISTPQTARYSAGAVRQYKALLDKLAALPGVVIAALNGDTMGGGLELVMACDIRIGEEGDYRYGHPEVRLGIIPGAGGTQRLARLIGQGAATEFILRGRVVRPEVALELGLVSEVVPDARARAREIADEIVTFPATGVANAKRAINLGNDSGIQHGFEAENLAWLEAMLSDDALTSMTTFLEVPLDKRRDWIENTSGYPKYTGH
ncbi:enoyl-CoA hydratase-related protein [Pseudonocardia eucalypti]|uniref:Enoyl-CoA hydratase-related protein n=1 Tax=Pseudonocardia eucalypti TaxID=648755 RepID=A0ABP9QX80_9PSEU|nr:enoyl-CoA hydratase [Pseudonocardia eucalypti]